MEGEPGDQLHQHRQGEVRRAHLQYSTSVFWPRSVFSPESATSQQRQTVKVDYFCVADQLDVVRKYCAVALGV